MKYPMPTVNYELDRPLIEARIKARHALRDLIAWLKPLPRRLDDLSHEQQMVFHALQQGIEGGATVTIPSAVFVQDRRAL